MGQRDVFSDRISRMHVYGDLTVMEARYTSDHRCILLPPLYWLGAWVDGSAGGGRRRVGEHAKMRLHADS
jgi:hypothetical protein